MLDDRVISVASLESRMVIALSHQSLLASIVVKRGSHERAARLTHALTRQPRANSPAYSRWLLLHARCRVLGTLRNTVEASWPRLASLRHRRPHLSRVTPAHSQLTCAIASRAQLFMGPHDQQTLVWIRRVPLRSLACMDRCTKARRARLAWEA